MDKPLACPKGRLAQRLVQRGCLYRGLSKMKIRPEACPKPMLIQRLVQTGSSSRGLSKRKVCPSWHALCVPECDPPVIWVPVLQCLRARRLSSAWVVSILGPRSVISSCRLRSWGPEGAQGSTATAEGDRALETHPATPRTRGGFHNPALPVHGALLGTLVML